MRKIFISVIRRKDAATLQKQKFHPSIFIEEEVEELTQKERYAVAGGPEVDNDPQG